MTRLSPLRRLAALDALAGLLAGGRVLSVSGDALLAVADELGAMPALCAAVRESREALPIQVHEPLREFHRGNTLRNARFRSQLVEIVGAFNAAGIEPLLIKGAARLLDGTLVQIGDRWLEDLDMVVPDASAAGEALLALDYLPITGKPFRHPHEVPYVRRGTPGPVELHGELGSPPLTLALPVTDGWSESVRLDYEGVRFKVLSPTHQVLHNILHSAVQDFNHSIGGLPLRQLADLAELTRAHRDAPVDWSEIHGRIAAQGLGRALQAHVWLAHRYAGLELPDSSWATHDRRHAARVRLNFALAWPADIQRNLRYAFGRPYLDSLYGHRDRPLALALARVRHAYALLKGDGRRALSEALTRRS